MADKKSKAKKGAAKKSSAKKAPKKAVTAKVKTTKATKTVAANAFFGKKYEGKETILSIFDSKKIVAVILAEVFGTMLLTMVLMSASIVTSLLPVYIWVALLAMPIALMAFSGAHFNPVLTVGMMASRRMSVSRGIVYIISQLIGAWFGFMIINAFRMSAGENAADLPTLNFEGMVGIVLALELVGTVIASFFFARAQAFRRSALTYGLTIGFGFMTALFIVFCMAQITGSADPTTGQAVTAGYILNPALALVYQAIPVSAEGNLFALIVQAICVYILVPMVGGVIGFCLSDLMKKMNGMTLAETDQPRELK